MIVDTHVHVFTDDRKKYPQIRDTSRAGSIPSVTEIGQTEWPRCDELRAVGAQSKGRVACSSGLRLRTARTIASAIVSRPAVGSARQPGQSRCRS